MIESTALATRSIFGIDADLLAATAILLGPTIAVASGLVVFRMQQQSQHAAERFLTNGVQSLHDTLGTLLSIHLQNYQIGMYILRAIKTYAPDHPLAPKPEEIPEFLGLRLESLPINSLLPVQELIGDKVILEWAMMAISDVTLEAKESQFQIRQPTAAYYRESLKLDKDEMVQGLSTMIEAWQSRVSTHFALLERLNDLAKHLATKRPWTVRGYYAVPKRKEIVDIVAQMKKGYESVKKVHAETEEVLRSGLPSSS